MSIATQSSFSRRLEHVRTDVVRRGAAIAANIATSFDFAKGRRERRNAAPLHLVNPRNLFGVAMAVLFALVMLDPVFGPAQSRNGYGAILGIAQHATDIGQSGWFIVPLAIALIGLLSVDWTGIAGRARVLLVNRMAALAFALTAIAGSGLLAVVLKYVIGRARPRHFEDYGAFSFHPFAFDASFAGFPSGHSTTLGAVAVVLALLFPRIGAPAAVLAVWLAFSRVVVGAHYPSDVIAGLAFGAWFAWWTATLFARSGFLFDAPRDGRLRAKRSLGFFGGHTRADAWRQTASPVD